MARQELNAVVTQRIEVAPGLIILRVAPDGWSLPEFIPGQFAVLGLPGSAERYPLSDPEEETPDPDKLIRRAYSIASSSIALESMEFYVTLVHSGSLTPRLFALETGDRVWLSSKVAGLFKLSDAPDDAHVVLVATGTGLAPYMSMLRTHLLHDIQRRFAVLHGARHSWDLGYQSELIAMQTLCKNFAYLPTVSRPANEPVEWNGDTGYVQDLWKRGVLDEAWGFHPTSSDTHVFLCGSPGMCEDMLELLDGEGFQENSRKKAGEIHVERYW